MSPHGNRGGNNSARSFTVLPFSARSPPRSPRACDRFNENRLKVSRSATSSAGNNLTSATAELTSSGDFNSFEVILPRASEKRLNNASAKGPKLRKGITLTNIQGELRSVNRQNLSVHGLKYHPVCTASCALNLHYRPVNPSPSSLTSRTYRLPNSPVSSLTGTSTD